MSTNQNNVITFVDLSPMQGNMNPDTVSGVPRHDLSGGAPVGPHLKQNSTTEWEFTVSGNLELSFEANMVYSVGGLRVTYEILINGNLEKTRFGGAPSSALEDGTPWSVVLQVNRGDKLTIETRQGAKKGTVTLESGQLIVR